MKYMKTKYFLTLMAVLLQSLMFTQGIINNGASLVFKGAGILYIDGNASANYRSLGNGIIYPSAASRFFLEGDWINNSANTGLNSDSGTVLLCGSNQVIRGSTSTYFYNLTLQGSGVKTQTINTYVGGKNATNGVLSLNSLAYNLNSNTLTVTNPNGSAITNSGGYIISETNLPTNPSCITWNMGVGIGTHMFPFGTLGGIQIPFYFDKTSVNASNISVATRATVSSDNLPWSSPVNSMYSPVIGGDASIPSVIDRWWDITATGTTTGNAVFSYLGSENTLSSSYNLGTLGAQNWNGAWAPPIGSTNAVLTGVGTVSASNISLLANSSPSMPWILSSHNSLLPIELIDFSINCFENDKIIANWRTAYEKNVSHFEVLNSDDAINFIKVGEVIANGNSNSVKNYSNIIDSKNNKGIYYILKVIDQDLTTTFSDIITLNKECVPDEENISMFYSPNNEIIIDAVSKINTYYKIEVLDAQGRVVYENSLAVGLGINKFTLSPQFVQGIYVLNLTFSDNKSINKKISVLY